MVAIPDFCSVLLHRARMQTRMRNVNAMAGRGDGSLLLRGVSFPPKRNSGCGVHHPQPALGLYFPMFLAGFSPVKMYQIVDQQLLAKCAALSSAGDMVEMASCIPQGRPDTHTSGKRQPVASMGQVMSSRHSGSKWSIISLSRRFPH